MTNKLWQLSAVELRDGIRNKVFSSVEVVSSVAERMSDANPALNAIVYDYSDQAVERAKEADTALASGENWGALHGVPVTVKVNVDVQDTPTTNGMEIFKDLIAPGNSPIVQNLLNAGAIISTSSGPTNLSAGGDINATAATIHLNG